MRTALGVAACLLLVAGCSADPAPEQDPTTGSGPTSAPTLDRAEVTGAVRAFRKAGTGSYYTRATLTAESPAVTHTGSYDLGTGYADELTTPAQAGAPASTVRLVATEQDTWASVGGCWLHFTPQDTETFGVDLGAGTLGLPPVGYVVSTLEAEPDGSVTSDLYSVLLLISGRTPRALGIAPESTDRVPVTLTIEDGLPVGIRVSPEQLVGAIEDAGLDPAVLGDAGDDLAVRVELRDFGDPVDVVGPPRRWTVEVVRSAARLTQAREECDQRLADAS